MLMIVYYRHPFTEFMSEETLVGWVKSRALDNGADPGGGGGDEGLVGPDLRYVVHRPLGPSHDDQGSSDQIHPQVHRDDHLRSRPVAGVGDED
ncbi:hypothetical protein R6Q57_023638 [Mikania cordata]